MRTKEGLLEMSSHAAEVAGGERFEFGENWSRFLSTLDDGRIARAVESLREMLEVPDLDGKSFLDIGSGSGLFSLAARRLGARVHSLDYDPRSVACTTELRRRYFDGDARWTVEEGSALDEAYIRSLGRFDVVYSWGVLHHTGQMWRGLANAALPVAEGGRLFVAIYNDTGSQSERWKWIKKTYNRLPRPLRSPFALAVMAPEEGKALLRSLVRLRPSEYAARWTRYDQNRGMSRWHDIIDWVGGHPYEVARPEEIFEFYKSRGFTLTKLKCGGVGLGCNEFVFVKGAA
ncbi:MAG: class I SAM-dependent methyltransferase [Acidobacteria bacterium]|nr:class I SAM-dependent methyltransferase [Acidobacteriota bacterium]